MDLSKDAQTACYIIYAVELALEAILALLSCVVLDAVRRCSLLHANLKILLVFKCVCSALLGTSRAVAFGIVLHQDEIRHSHPAFVFITHMMSAVNSFLCLAYMTERFLATVFVRTYEKQRPYYGIVCVVVMTFVSGYNAFKDTIARGDPGKVSQDESAKFSTSTLIASYVNVLAVLLCMLAVGVLHKYASRRQRRRLEDGREVNLTERYQNSENIRTTRQLLPVIFLHFLTALFAGIYLAAAAIWPNTGTTYLPQVALGFANCILYMLCEVALLHFNPALRVEAAGRLRRFKQAVGSRSGTVAPTSGLAQPEPALGTAEEANFYFMQLEDAWDRHYERQKNS